MGILGTIQGFNIERCILQPVKYSTYTSCLLRGYSTSGICRAHSHAGDMMHGPQDRPVMCSPVNEAVREMPPGYMGTCWLAWPAVPRQARLQRGRGSELCKSLEDEEAKASGRGEGGRMAQTQRAANRKGHTDERARVLGQNLRAGGQGPRTESHLERQTEL